MQVQNLLSKVLFPEILDLFNHIITSILYFNHIISITVFSTLFFSISSSQLDRASAINIQGQNQI